MCGIIGVAGDLTGREESLFKSLLVVNTLRGMDSVGVAAVGKEADVKVVKTVGDPFQLFDLNEFQSIMRRKNHVLIGHNRAATTGKVVRRNAHPFEFSSIVGVHNGTLTNKHSIPDNFQFDTDSEALYNQINKVGIEEAIKNVSGAYALVWFDKDENTINFLRNKERPLNLILSEDKKNLFFCSETWMVTNILGRENYKFNTPEVLPEDTLVSFKVPEQNQVFEKARVRTVKPVPFAMTVHHSTKGGGTTTDVTKKGNIFDARDYLKKRTPQSSVKNVLDMKAGDLIEDLEATHYSKNTFGAMFVAFTSKTYPGIKFRCYQKDAESCSEILKHKGLYQADISFIGYVINAELEVKLSPNSLVETVIEIPLIKVDHHGLEISKEKFENNYTVCAWCSSPVLYKEEFVAFSSSQCLCEGCSQDPEVKQYLPDLKRGGC